MVTIPVGERSVALSDFLTDFFVPTDDQELVAARASFLSAGLNAINWKYNQRWIQFGLERPTKAVYAELAATVRTLLADHDIVDFFFMHKEPGLRVRFAVQPGKTDSVQKKIRVTLDRWQVAGLIGSASPGIYEPESALFGGPISMEYVHQLFTRDSLIWLDYHAGIYDVPSWALSLIMLRAVFDGLHIVGWEDRGVWGRVRDIGHRKLAQTSDQESPAQAMEQLRNWWSSVHTATAQLPEPVQQLVASYKDDVQLLTQRWWSDYFKTDKATVGPREAASYYVIFHWNRAALKLGRQILFTEALAAAPTFHEDIR